MLSRSAIAAGSCLQFRIQILRPFAAVISRPRPRHVGLAARQIRPFRPLSTWDDDSVNSKDAAAQVPEGLGKPTDSPASVVESDGSETPWYLEVEPPRHFAEHEASPLPAIPQSSPDILMPTMKYVYEQMGLDDLTLLDLRRLDPPPAFGPNLMMLFGTARSERHLHIASSRFVHWLRREFGVNATADGLIIPGELKIKLRRLRRKAKLAGGSSVTLGGGDDGISTGWICIDLGTLGNNATESAHFDKSGRISGFGSVAHGTTIVVQVMTERRRAELDLETLWTRALARSEEATKKLEELATEEGASQNDFDEWEALQRLRPSSGLIKRPGPAQSHARFYSTQRVLDIPLPEAGLPVPTAELSDPLAIPRRMVEELEFSSKPVDQAAMLKLLRSIFQIAPKNDGTVRQQAYLATDLLRTMFERGQLTLDSEVLVSIIESIAKLGCRSPELQRIQTNMEHLLKKANIPCPTEDQLIRLLDAYAAQGNWDQFWYAWRIPPRFLVRRTPKLYHFVYARAAETKNQTVCIDTLRNCVQEMLHEDPPVRPGGALLRALHGCIYVADPTVVYQSMLESMTRTYSKHEAKKEFVKIWQDVRAISQNPGDEAASNASPWDKQFRHGSHKGLRNWSPSPNAA